MKISINKNIKNIINRGIALTKVKDYKVIEQLISDKYILRVSDDEGCYKASLGKEIENKYETYEFGCGSTIANAMEEL